MRRLTLFDNMSQPPESQSSRTLVTASSQYGITIGGYTADYLELTELGRVATGEENSANQRLKARFQLAVQGNQWFLHLYSRFTEGRLPTESVLADSLREAGLDAEFTSECVETFIVNAKYLGILRTVAGAERLLTIEHVLEDYETEPEALVGSAQPPATADQVQVPNGTKAAERIHATQVVAAAATPLDNVCFYISPIGPADSEQRMHADLFMGALVEPALHEFGLTLVRADQIGRAGLISAQMIEHIAICPLVIADLSYHNPNVFYELALRHAVKKPIVQLIRKEDRIPFDLQQFRTVVIDTTSIYTLVPQLETYRAQIASQIRTALDAPDENSNPIAVFYPSFWNQSNVT